MKGDSPSGFFLMMTLMVSILLTSFSCKQNPPVYQATGIKIGEVTDSTAVIWTRLTKTAERLSADLLSPVIEYQNPQTGEWLPKAGSGRADWLTRLSFPGRATVDSLEGAAPGIDGEVRVLYKNEHAADWLQTDWYPVRAQHDYTRKIYLTGLNPASRYQINVESRSTDQYPGATVSGGFKTAPSAGMTKPVIFTVVTGQAYADQDTTAGYKIYPRMRELDPDFFVHTGDIVYYDHWAKTADLARWGWARMYSLPSNKTFHRQVASYFIKDDHDTWMDDCWPTKQTRFMGEFTFAQGQQIFLDEVPVDNPAFRTFRWGKDLQIWLVEGRDFRSANDMPDGPQKSIWGEKQKEWFKSTVLSSDATFRILISPTPLVGPDRVRKNDNHANRGFKTEGDELRRFIAEQKNMFVICGDRHWQYISEDPSTKLKEYCSGPVSNAHAGGWKQADKFPQHQYLNVTGGFLSVTIKRSDQQPVAVMRHHSVDGIVLHEDMLTAR